MARAKYDEYNQFAAVDLKNKQAGVNWYVNLALRKTSRMIDYKGLPESIDKTKFIRWLQTNGYVIITDKPDGVFRCFFGGLGGELDEYYRPTIATIANPGLGFNEQLKIGEECVVIRNDSILMGLAPIFTRFASQLVENDLTIRTLMINSRMQNILSAGDSQQIEAANEYFKKIENGDLSAILGTRLVDMITPLHDIATGRAVRPITEYIELEQYLKASMYQEVGLNANYNMKREAINEAEAGMNDDVLVPLVEDMVETQRADFEMFRKLYGIEVTPELSSAWKRKEVMIDAQIDKLQDEAAADGEVMGEPAKEEEGENDGKNDA